MEYEVYAQNKGEVYVSAQFRLRAAALDFAQYRNTSVGRRVWRVRRIEK